MFFHRTTTVGSMSPSNSAVSASLDDDVVELRDQRDHNRGRRSGHKLVERIPPPPDGN
jgi:hypothetical protein